MDFSSKPSSEICHTVRMNLHNDRAIKAAALTFSAVERKNIFYHGTGVGKRFLIHNLPGTAAILHILN